MPEEKYVFLMGGGSITENGFMLIVEFAWHSGPAIRRHGVRKFLLEVQREIPEVTLINFEHVQSKLANITLRGKRAQGDTAAKEAFGREVAAKLDAIVIRLVD